MYGCVSLMAMLFRAVCCQHFEDSIDKVQQLLWGPQCAQVGMNRPLRRACKGAAGSYSGQKLNKCQSMQDYQLGSGRQEIVVSLASMLSMLFLLPWCLYAFCRSVHCTGGPVEATNHNLVLFNRLISAATPCMLPKYIYMCKVLLRI